MRQSWEVREVKRGNMMLRSIVRSMTSCAGWFHSLLYGLFNNSTPMTQNQHSVSLPLIFPTVTAALSYQLHFCTGESSHLTNTVLSLSHSKCDQVINAYGWLESTCCMLPWRTSLIHQRTDYPLIIHKAVNAAPLCYRIDEMAASCSSIWIRSS